MGLFSQAARDKISCATGSLGRTSGRNSSQNARLQIATARPGGRCPQRSPLSTSPPGPPPAAHAPCAGPRRAGGKWPSVSGLGGGGGSTGNGSMSCALVPFAHFQDLELARDFLSPHRRQGSAAAGKESGESGPRCGAVPAATAGPVRLRGCLSVPAGPALAQRRAASAGPLAGVRGRSCGAGWVSRHSCHISTCKVRLSWRPEVSGAQLFAGVTPYPVVSR